jgi:hypothetical protein
MKMMLNSRNKAGLFLTTVVAGLCLILGENFRETLGAIFIGFALTWAFGSTNKMLRICIGALGLLLFFAPVVIVFIDHHNSLKGYEQSVKNFRSQLPQLAKEHPDIAAGIMPRSNDPYEALAALYGGKSPDDKEDVFTTASRTLDIPDVGTIYFPSDVTARDIAQAFRSAKDHKQPPDWYLEALDAGIDPAQISYLSPPADKPKPLNVWSTITEGVWVELPSIALALTFFGSLLADQRRNLAI